MGRGIGRLAPAAALAAALLGAGGASAQDVPSLVDASNSPTVDALRELSIKQLAELQVTSVAKRPTALSDAAAAIFVITHEDIVRSGAVTLPEMLRLAPNLQVYQQSASNFIVTARGFAGNAPEQSFSNLMLVLIDGRSVYNPLFTGIYWDMQDIVPDDIERIEVISGPAGTLWGANAVNGVINIITRKASDTQGGLLDYTNGTQERTISGQWGGHIGETFAFRLYGRSLVEYDTVQPNGAKANDEWSKPQGGFRFDWTPDQADAVILRGDYFQGSEAAQGAPDTQLDGRDVLARWTHQWQGGGALDVLAYWDREARASPDQSGSSFFVDAYDLEAQDAFALGAHQQVVVGAGVRISRYGIADTHLVWTPSRGRLDVSDLFLQDTIALGRGLTLIAGAKLENDPFSGVSPMPSLRLSWKARDDVLVWAAASRAIRAPTPFDTDVTELVGGKPLLHGTPGFLPEKLTAYELGVRLQPTALWSISASAYENVYDDLRNIQASPAFFPLYWGNDIHGHTRGVEIWTDYRATPWWRLTAAVDVLFEALRFKPGATTLLPLDQDGNDPRHTARIRSSMDLGRRVAFDVDIRYVDALPAPSDPAYVEADSRLAWRLTPRLELSVAGFNLLHARHQELPASEAQAVPRSVRGEIRVGF